MVIKRVILVACDQAMRAMLPAKGDQARGIQRRADELGRASVQAGELDPTTIDGWIAKTHDVKPELDKEKMGAIFIKYKGAEAGEVDWRPTETVPEDYYAL